MQKMLKSTLNSLLTALKTLGLMLVMVVKALFLLPILLFMIWLSYYVDPSAFFHGDKFELEAARALLDGSSLSHYEQLDERQINNLHIENSPEAFDVVILGSSRALQLGEELIPDHSFYNYGMISATYADLCNIFYKLVEEDRVPENTVVVIDPWVLFYDDSFYQDARTDYPLYEEFLSEALGKTSTYVPVDNTDAYEAILSPSFFQSSFDYYLRGGDLEERPQILDGNIYSQDTEIKRYDGTIIYTEEYRTRPQETRDLDALGLALTDRSFVHGFGPLSQEGKNLFIELVEYMLQSGTNVIFMMTPYHNIVYDTVLDKYEVQPGTIDGEAFIHELGEKYDIPVHGSYDPYALNCVNTDFYDHIHVTADGIAKFIDPMLDDLV